MSGQHHRTPSTNLQCTARGRPTTSAGCCFAARPVPARSSAAVLQGLCRSDHPPAVFACSGPVQPALLACHLCNAMPTALLNVLAPFCFDLPPPPCSFPCTPASSRKQQFASCKNCPIGSYNAGLQWRPVHRVAFTHHSLCCKDCPVSSHARRLHLRSSCAVVRCSHVKRGRSRTACEGSSTSQVGEVERVESAHPRPGPCCRLPRRGTSLLSGARTISPRSRDYASGTEHPPFPPFDPEHQQFPSPIIRAEIVPEAPFVALSSDTCRRDVQAADRIGGGSESRSRVQRWATRSGKS